MGRTYRYQALPGRGGYYLAVGWLRGHFTTNNSTINFNNTNRITTGININTNRIITNINSMTTGINAFRALGPIVPVL